jgi:hypothetical protein
VGGWPQALDDGIEGEHPSGRCVAGVIGVEAAGDGLAAGDQIVEPGRIGLHAGRGYADPLGIELKATDRIASGLTGRNFPETLDAGSRPRTTPELSNEERPGNGGTFPLSTMNGVSGLTSR